MMERIAHLKVRGASLAEYKLHIIESSTMIIQNFKAWGDSLTYYHLRNTKPLITTKAVNLITYSS